MSYFAANEREGETVVSAEGADSDVDHKVNALCFKFPDEFEENQRLVRFIAETCLKFRNGNSTRAEERMRSYLQWRKSIFGNLRDQSCNNDVKLRTQVSSLFVQISPKRLPEGEALVYLTMLRHSPSLFSADDTVRYVHFMIMNAIKQDPTLAEKGFVLVNNMTGVGIFNLDIAVPQALASAMSQCLPIRVRTMVIFSPPLVIRFVVPAIKAIVSSKMGDRIHVMDQPSDLLGHLNLTEDYLPVAVKGAVELEDKAALADLLSNGSA